MRLWAVAGATGRALATGQIRIVNGQVVSGFFAGWLTPFALVCGVFALGLFAFLAATYLTLDRQDQHDLQKLLAGTSLTSIVALVALWQRKFALARIAAPSARSHSSSWGGAWRNTPTSSRRTSP